MRRRAWWAWGLLAASILLGLAGRFLPAGSTWDLLAGLALLAALVLGITLLPFWRNFLPGFPAFPGLFKAPRASERWCTRCGNPTPSRGACRSCGHSPSSQGR